MLNQPTLQRLQQLKLTGMAHAFQQLHISVKVNKQNGIVNGCPNAQARMS